MSKSIYSPKVQFHVVTLRSSICSSYTGNTMYNFLPHGIIYIYRYIVYLSLTNINQYTLLCMLMRLRLSTHLIYHRSLLAGRDRDGNEWCRGYSMRRPAWGRTPAHVSGQSQPLRIGPYDSDKNPGHCTHGTETSA